MLTYEVKYHKLSFVFSKRLKGKGGGGEHSKKDDGAMMVVVFTMTEISYSVVGLFNNLVRPLLF